MASNTNTPTTPAPLLIDAKAACALLCMDKRRLWVLSNRRAIPSFKIGKSRRYCPDELRAWVRAGCPTHAGPPTLPDRRDYLAAHQMEVRQ